MDCNAFKTAIHDLAKGFTPEHEREALQARADAHQAGCADCQDFMRVVAAITCRELIDFLNDYIDDALQPERREVFDRHLAICSDCTNYLESYRRTMSLSVAALRGSGATVEAPPESLLRAILDARKRE